MHQRIRLKPLAIPNAFIVICGVLTALNVTSEVRADLILYDSGVRQPNTAYGSDAGSTSGQLLFDDFTLDSDSVLSRIEWTGVYGNGVAAEDFFEIKVFRDISPDTGVYDFETVATFQSFTTFRNNTGIPLLGRDVFQYSADLTDISPLLTGNELLYLSIFNETPGNNWAWGGDNSFGEAYFRSMATGGNVLAFQATMDFTISGVTAVPEPSSLAMLGLVGGLGMVLRLKRRFSRNVGLVASH